MKDESFDPSFTQILRESKAVYDDAWIASFLKRAPVGVLATAFGDQPFLSPKLFLYEEAAHAIFLHSADEGRVLTNIKANPKVCFTAFEMGNLFSGKLARSFGVEFASVVVFGKIRIVDDSAEVLRVLGVFMEKYAPQMQMGVDYPLIAEEELDGMVLYQLDIQAWSGKQDTGKPGSPRNYRYEDVVR
jgi:nitroimidazol reductase NimA-like FMN-containing flavoprotein (pyridoxamine 5'-phosphate oxidase superfamily)